MILENLVKEDKSFVNLMQNQSYKFNSIPFATNPLK
jgi:hypothetical protein